MVFPAFALLIAAFCGLLAPFTEGPVVRGITIFFTILLIGTFQLRMRALARKDRPKRVSVRSNPTRRSAELPPSGVRILNSYVPESAAAS